jgi:hypothetical protein
VSSYGRNAFTRGHSCLCLVRSPLYTSAAATCPGSPHLRRRGSDPGLGGVAPLRTSCPRAPQAPDAMSPVGAPRSWSSRTFVAGARPSVPSAPKVGAATWDHSCTQNSHSMSGISVSLAPVRQRLPHGTEAIHRPKVVGVAERG